MKYARFLMAASLMLAACSGLNEFEPDEKAPLDLDKEELVERVVFDVPDLRFLGEEDATRASLSQDTTGTIHFVWETTDTLGIYPDQGAQVFFAMTNGAGTNVASFDGGGWALRKNVTYSCYLPFVGNIYLKRDAIPVSFTDQVQNGVSNYEGIRFYLASKGTRPTSGDLQFTFQYLNTIIRIKPTGLPAGTYTKLSISTEEPLFVQKGSFNLDEENMAITGETYSNSLEVSLKSFTITENTPLVYIYLTSAPVDLAGKTVTIRMFADDGSVYRCEKKPTYAYEAPGWGGLSCDMARIVSNVYDGSRGILTFDGDVTEIGDQAFENCSTLTGIEIPESVKRIGDYAFSGCTNLGADNTSASMPRMMHPMWSFRSGESSFVIPDGVTSIGAYAFQDCTSLTSITVPDTVDSIGEGAFMGCSSLSTIDLPDDITDWGENVLSGCTGLSSVTIPDGVTSIDAYAFAGCDHLTEVIIPESVTSIGQHAFENCENLVSITIPNGVTRIESFTFAGCVSLPRIIIPNGVKSIGNSAFESCHVMANVSLPSGLEYLGTYAFASCMSFTTFSIPRNITWISDGLLWNCDHLINVNIHEDVEGIGDSAFSECSALTRIAIPNNVTTIEKSAFMDSGLTSVTRPEHVPSIGDQAFMYCRGLTYITVHAATPPANVTETTFQDTNDCLIYVPSESLNAYKAADGWSNYTSRICDHVYVDMGNGMKWATTNVGAIGPDDLGDYFTWGGTEPVTPSTNSTSGSFTDTANAIWGGNWRMPTLAEWQALMDSSNYTWIWDPVRKGYIVKSNVTGFVGNIIFLPAAGVVAEPGICYLGEEGDYWSSSLYPDSSAYCLSFMNSVSCMSEYTYGAGLSVRPIYESEPLGNMENPYDTGREISLDD